MTSIPVAHPAFWWRMPVERARQVVPEDPDLESRRRRWSDRDQQRWPLIAQAVIRVSDALAEGHWLAPDDPPSLSSPAEVQVATDDLTPTELHIVRTWFSFGEAIRLDPWANTPLNGRHRLWATIEHFETQLIPVAGEALGYTNPEDLDVQGPDWPQLFADHLDEMKFCDWFDESDLLNMRFLAAMQTAARGEIPSPI